jgi:hypothetical protein
MWRALLLVAALSSVAVARPKPRPLKPTKAEQAALDLATDWVAKLGESAAAARKLSSPKLVSLALTDEANPCPEASNADRGLACFHDKVAPKGKPAIWRHTLGGPLKPHGAKIDQLAKGAIVIQLDEGCDGTENQLLIVVKGKLVTGAFAQTYACSE